jgi:hypothetical protein
LDGLLNFVVLNLSVLLHSDAAIIFWLFHLQEEVDSILVLIFLSNVNVTSHLRIVSLEVKGWIQEVCSVHYLGWLLANLEMVLPCGCLWLEVLLPGLDVVGQEVIALIPAALGHTS